MKTESHKKLNPLLWRRFKTLAAGGGWSSQVTRDVRTSLRWFLLDGLFANASGSILGTYQSLFLLALGATRREIGLLGSLANLMLPLAMLPGSWLAQRVRHFKPLVVVASVVGRLLILGLVFLPVFTSSSHLVSLGMMFIVMYGFCMHLANPAWTSLVGKIVPARWRGRYFSTRNIFMSLSSFIILLLMGQVVDRLATPLGYQIALAVAVMLGLISSFAFTQVQEPTQAEKKRQRTRRGVFWQQVRQQPKFLLACLTATLWNFGVQIAGPFFIIYLVDEAQASATAVGVATAVASLAALPGQRVFGALSDRRGARWVQLMTGFVIPLVPGIWGFINRPWQAYPIQMLSGFAWAGYNLAAFNTLLDLTPDEDRPAYVAFFQTSVGLGMAIGAALGAGVVQRFGYHPIFLISGGIRLLAAVLFALLIAKSEFTSTWQGFRKRIEIGLSSVKIKRQRSSVDKRRE